MRSFTVTKGDPSRFRILPLIERHGLDPTFICDNAAQRASLIEMGVCRTTIRVSNIPRDAGITGVSRARDFAVRTCIPKNEWTLWIDDNLSNITGIPFVMSQDVLDLNSGASWRKLFAQSLSRGELNAYIIETIEKANSLNTIFAAFANENNFYFRSRKWQFYGYCRTQLALYKNDRSSWFPFSSMMLEDWYKSLDVIARYGCVLINRHVKAEKPPFEQGGIGSFDRRLPHLIENCRKLAEMFPGLVKPSGNGAQYGRPEAAEFSLQFLKRSKTTVDRWRQENGYADSN